MKKDMKSTNDNLAPIETALAKASEGTEVQLRSRAHLLAIIDSLDLGKESVDVKMSFVLALLSLGFSPGRAVRRLGMRKDTVDSWRRKNDENRRRYLEAKSRGELMLEETILLAAERDPVWAKTILTDRDKETDEVQEKEKDTYDATVFLKKGKKDPLL